MLECCSKVFFTGHVLYLQNHNCPGTVPEKKGSLGRFTFRLVARSWTAAVLSLTHCHEPASVCHTAVVKLWHFDESSVSACWYRVYDTIPSPSAIRWHILRNCQNTFEIVQNWVQAATADRKMLRLGMGALAFLIYVTPFNHDGYLPVFPPKLMNSDVQRNAWRRGALCCEVMLKWGWNGDLTLSVKSS